MHTYVVGLLPIKLFLLFQNLACTDVFLKCIFTYLFFCISLIFDDVFSVFQGNLNCISVSTQKDLVEMDIGGILNPPAWLDDVTEYDIETINK